MTPSNNNLPSDTHSPSTIEKLVNNASVVDEPTKRANTCTSSVTVGATVPSSITAQKTWLRYNPQRIRTGSSDSSTQL